MSTAEGGKEGEAKAPAKAASPEPEKPGASKPAAAAAKPSAATAASSAPVPDKTGLLDKLKKMLPGDKAAKK